jgi:hypothetical protein
MYVMHEFSSSTYRYVIYENYNTKPIRIVLYCPPSVAQNIRQTETVLKMTQEDLVKISWYKSCDCPLMVSVSKIISTL